MIPETKEHINNGLKTGIRLDGRKLDEFRPITIEKGLIGTAEGSAKVICGDVEIIAGVKMDLGTPYADSADEGVLMVGAELLPLSNPEFESGPPSIDSIEISRVIDRGIRESQTIDVKSLCVEAGEKVWMVNVDICPINYNGNLIDLGSLASLAALQNTLIPEIVDGAADFKNKSSNKLKIQELPIAITVLKIGENLLVDPTDKELEAADARLTVTTLEDGKLCAMQKGGGPLTIEEINDMIALATTKGSELRALLKK